jgi:hypothetical protein
MSKREVKAVIGMNGKDRAYGAIEELAEGTRESYVLAFNHAVRLAERNVRNFWGVFGSVSREVVGQVEANRMVAQDLLRRAEQQRGALRSVVDEATDAYFDALYAPLALYGAGLQRFAPEIESSVASAFDRFVSTASATTTRAADAATSAVAEVSEAQGAAVSDILTKLPIQDYDGLNAAQVTERLSDLSTEELEKVRAYEERHKNRRGLIAQIDRRREAAS